MQENVRIIPVREEQYRCPGLLGADNEANFRVPGLAKTSKIAKTVCN